MAAAKPLLIIDDNPADYAHYMRLLEHEHHGFSGFEHISDF